MKNFSRLFLIIAVLYVVASTLYFLGDKFYLAAVNGLLAGMFIWVSVKVKRRP